jgi:hypothetical protein
MKLTSKIFTKKRREFLKFAELKKRIAEAQERKNLIAIHVDEAKKRVNAATAKLYSDPRVENFETLVNAQIYADTAQRSLTDTYSSLSVHSNEQFTESTEALEILAAALGAYAEELAKEINQICADAQALADRSGIEYSEPVAVATLRRDMSEAQEGAIMCRDDTPNSTANPWAKYSGLIRIGDGARES